MFDVIARPTLPSLSDAPIMAIDFGKLVGKTAEAVAKVATGRSGRNILTGYLGAKIANTEANDAMNADIIKRAGINFIENTLPEFQKKEKTREREFKQISDFFGSDAAANWFGDRGHITGDGNSLNTILATLKAKNLNPNTFKKDFKWEGSTYEERRAERIAGIQDREKTIMGLTSGSSYQWRVQGMCDSLGTNMSPWTSIQSFTNSHTLQEN